MEEIRKELTREELEAHSVVELLPDREEMAQPTVTIVGPAVGAANLSQLEQAIEGGVF